ncbi:hypothetical protein B1A_16748, partial [mine drainage metagenome]
SQKQFSFLFESRETLLNQINEMIFVENVHDREEIERLIRVYNEQMPGNNEISITMFIEITDDKALIRELPKLAGIENHVFITYDNRMIRGIPEEGRSTEVLESTVQYLKFRFSREEIQNFKGAKHVFIGIEHKGYNESVKLSEELLSELKIEFKG